jgi:catechol 2,3-dioxygenase-like lactoylglutathione lyase family enzyme
MFSHVMIGSNDLTRSKSFYDALFAPIGGKPGTQDPKWRLVHMHNGGRFMVTRPIDGQPATRANGGTIGFTIASPAEVDARRRAGTENGGTAIEDPPGVRQGAAGALYRLPAGPRRQQALRPAQDGLMARSDAPSHSRSG